MISYIYNNNLGGKKMNNKINQLKELIQKSNNIVFFGGAGVSTESNIPDFRSSSLSAEQHRQLYDWVERSVFQTEPEKYEH